MIAHLIACTIAALIALAASLALRGQRAGLRHTILFLALLRFLLPTGLLRDTGRLLVRVAPVKTPENLEWLLLSPRDAGTAVQATGAASGVPWLGLVWVLGIAVCLALWARRARFTIPAVRMPSDYEAEVFRRFACHAELRIVPADAVPGAWGWLHPRVLLPDGLSAELTEPELEAVLVHEAAHLRRKDNLTAAIARAIVSLFWFHPLAWWLEHCMMAERETACDELVLSNGSSAEDYVTAISKVCRLSFAGAHGYAGVTGSNLKDRMEFIMSVDLNRRSSRVARALPGLFVAFALMLPVAGGYLRAQQTVTPEQKNAAEARFQDGVKLLGEKAYDAAMQAFRDSWQQDPTNPRGLMGQVEVKTAQGLTREALQLLQDEIAKHPDDRLDLWLQLGNTAVRAGAYDQALDAYRKVQARTEKNSQAAGDLYLRIGETYRRKGDLESAIANVRLARQISPDNVAVLSTLAMILDASGKKDEAESEYRAVLRIAPNNGVSLNNLAFLVSERNGDLNEALDMAKKARELMPKLSEVSDTLAWIYLKKNLPDSAIPLLDELVRTQPANAEYHRHLGMALDAKGDHFAAFEQYAMAEKLKAK